MATTGKGIDVRSEDGNNLLMLLKEAQSKFGYLSHGTLTELAQSLEVPLSEVYGVATFYSFLPTEPQGRNIIRICKSIPCLLKNGQLIVDSLARELGIRLGQTTPDGRFSFQLTNCIGACDRAPAMMINNDVHVDLTPEKIAQILEEYQ